jgi:hypothetical protein
MYMTSLITVMQQHCRAAKVRRKVDVYMQEWRRTDKTQNGGAQTKQDLLLGDGCVKTTHGP